MDPHQTGHGLATGPMGGDVEDGHGSLRGSVQQVRDRGMGAGLPRPRRGVDAGAVHARPRRWSGRSTRADGGCTAPSRAAARHCSVTSPSMPPDQQALSCRIAPTLACPPPRRRRRPGWQCQLTGRLHAAGAAGRRRSPVALRRLGDPEPDSTSPVGHRSGQLPSLCHPSRCGVVPATARSSGMA